MSDYMASVKAAMQKAKKGGFQGNEEYFYYPQRDQAGNGTATLRFLPVAGEMPFVTVYSHNFQNPLNQKWYIEECPTTIGEPCPCCEANTSLWDTGSAGQDIVKGTGAKNARRSRRTQFISYVYVVKDPATPSNEGKVFKFKYGKEILDILLSAMEPEFKDITPVQVFDLEGGANFTLRIRKVDGQVDYAQSSFGTPSPLTVDMSQVKSLEAEYKAATRFKSYDDLSKRLAGVLGNAVRMAQNASQSASATSTPVVEQPVQSSAPAQPSPVAAAMAAASSGSEDAEIAAMMAKLNGDGDVPQ